MAISRPCRRSAERPPILHCAKQRRRCLRHVLTDALWSTSHAPAQRRMCGASIPMAAIRCNSPRSAPSSPGKTPRSTARTMGSGSHLLLRTPAPVPALGECRSRAAHPRSSRRISTGRALPFRPTASWSRYTCGEKRRPVHRCLAAIPAQGGDPVYHFDAPAGMFGLAWSPDSKAFQYVLTRDGVGNRLGATTDWWTREATDALQNRPDL